MLNEIIATSSTLVLEKPAGYLWFVRRTKSLHMLIYLDTSHFSRLEQASLATREEFFAVWKEYGCELAVSLLHFQEFGQLADRSSISRRLSILDQFHRVRCNPTSVTTLVELEAEIQLIQKLGYRVDIQRSAVDTLFPVRDIDTIRAEVLAAAPLFRHAQAALRLSAEATQLSKAAKTTEANLVDPTFFTVSLEKYFEGFPGLVPQAASIVSELSSNFPRAVSTNDPRLSLVHLYGLSDLQALPDILDSDLAGTYMFLTLAKDRIHSLVNRLPGVSEAEIKGALLALSPYDSPGVALKLAVSRARQNHPKPDVASDHVDEDHVAFAPYVGLLFADRRTAAFVRQERAHRPNTLPDSAGANVRVAADLDSVSAAIREGAA